MGRGMATGAEKVKVKIGQWGFVGEVSGKLRATEAVAGQVEKGNAGDSWSRGSVDGVYAGCNRAGDYRSIDKLILSSFM